MMANEDLRWSAMASPECAVCQQHRSLCGTMWMARTGHCAAV